MVISFDLDDTLIPGIKNFETEKQNFFQRMIGLDRIRYGTTDLFKILRSHGHKIYIYTTSYRSIVKIKLTFYFYGIPIDKVINQQIHTKELRELKTRTSKYPPAFGIDIHIDDSYGVKKEGDNFNFKTVIIDENEINWENKILNNL